MKQGWEIKRLGDISDLQNGFAFKSADYIDSSNTMNFRMSQIKPGGGVDLENNPRYLPDSYAIRYKEYLLKEGDVVIAMTDLATETKILGVPTIVPKDARNWLLNQRVGKLFKIDFSKVDITYLKYILTSETVNEYYKSLGRGGLQINIGKQDILNAKIPLPPLPEQQRIVAILDEAFEAIATAKANAEQNLKNARELFENYLHGVFENKGEGWEDMRLGEIATFRNGMNFTKASKGEVIKIVGVRDFQKSFWVPLDSLESVTIDGKLNEFDLLKEDDILAVRSNGNPALIGRTLLAGDVIGKVSHSGFTIRIRLNSKNISSLYLCHFLKTPRARKELVESGTGVNIKSLNQGALSSLVISFPKSITTQQTIVAKLDALSSEAKRLEAIYQQKIYVIEELKKSVLQKAFNGELKNVNI